jgi:uncharacterized protein DUF1579
VEGTQVTARRLALAALLGGCAPAAHPAAPATPAPPAAPAASAAPATKPCTGPEFHQFDFWIGDWELTVRGRNSPTSDQWGEAKGQQHVESILSGCAIAEHFSADGPGTPWAGASYSSWQPQQSAWRQTWVDDSGGFLVFRGKLENGAMALYGEPRDVGGKQIQMRMVFRDITATSLRWEWQRSDDSWATEAPMITIDYRRSR